MFTTSPIGDGKTKIPTYIHKIDTKGNKKLAYEITRKGEAFTTGWYTVFTYSTSPERVIQIENILRKDTEVLKFITVKLESTDDHVMSEQIEKSKPENDAFDLIFGEI